MVGFWLWILWKCISIMRPEWIIALATLVYAALTLWIILEMRKDRKLLHKPFLDATLKGACYPDWLLFEVKNVGRGPALNCEFLCKDDGELEWKTVESLFPVGSNKTIEMRFEVLEKYGKKFGNALWLEVSFTDIFNRSDRRTIFRSTAEAVMCTFRGATGGSAHNV